MRIQEVLRRSVRLPRAICGMFVVRVKELLLVTLARNISQDLEHAGCIHEKEFLEGVARTFFCQS